MEARLLVPAERMSDLLDRTASLTFTVVARVEGALEARRLERGLRCLEGRHPLLRARIERAPNLERFVFSGAQPIPLTVVDAPEEDTLALAAETLSACEWPDVGPRARLIWLRHAPGRSSLLLSLHHTSSDGISGMLLMRDLLTFATRTEPADVEVAQSPGQEAFFPAQFTDMKTAWLAALARDGMPEAPPALRLGSAGAEPGSRTGVERFVLDEPRATRLLAYARAHGATVHGVLSAAFGLAVAEEGGAQGLLRMVHPVDLRRYLRERDAAAAIGEACGYYVSAVSTEHEVHAQSALGALAREVSLAVRAAKDRAEPLATAPVRGALLVELGASMPAAAFRQLADRTLFVNTFSFSNLARLEALNISERLGGLALEELYFVAATSVLARMGATAVSFRGRLSFQLTYITPSIQAEQARRVARRIQQQLVQACT